jgi:hypothetical protein
MAAFIQSGMTPVFGQSNDSASRVIKPLAADTQFEGTNLVEDIDILEHAFKSLHPGLYRYNTPAEIDLKFARLRDKLGKGATLSETYLELAGFGASIRCGHTYPNFFNQSESVVEALFKGKNRLPFEFVWLDGKMIVTRNLAAINPINAGSEVVAINGISTRTILDRLMKFTRADGSNDAKRRSYLQLQGMDRYDAFDIFYALCYPLVTPQFDLSLRDKTGLETKHLSVNPLSFEDRIAQIQKSLTALEDGDSPAWTLTFLDQQTAFLKMPSWVLYNSKWDWKTFLSQTFTNLAQHPDCALIIDLRNNVGGLSEPGDVIIRHLISHDPVWPSLQRFTRYRTAPRNLEPYLDTWDSSFLDWGTNAANPAFQTTGNAVYYRLTRYDDDSKGNVLHPLSPTFRGKVVVLMNAENSSATFQFEQMLQDNKLAKLIGEPSGGNRRGINGDAFIFLRLPNSKIEMDIPLVATFPGAPQPDAGLIPDRAANMTREGIAKGRDEILDAALKFLGRKPAQKR